MPIKQEIEKERYLVTWLIEDPDYERGYRLYHSSEGMWWTEENRSGTPEHWVFLHKQIVQIEEPEFDVRELMLKSLEGSKQRLMAEYSATMASIEDRISKLTALEVD